MWVMGLELFLESIAVMSTVLSCSFVWKIGSVFLFWGKKLFENWSPSRSPTLVLLPTTRNLFNWIPCSAPFWQTAFWEKLTKPNRAPNNHSATCFGTTKKHMITWTFNMQHLRVVSSLEGSIAVGGEDLINLAGFCRLESHSCKEFVPVCSIYSLWWCLWWDWCILEVWDFPTFTSRVEKDPLKVIIQPPNCNKHCSGGDGRVVTWGDRQSGGDSDDVQEQLINVQETCEVCDLQSYQLNMVIW